MTKAEKEVYQKTIELYNGRCAICGNTNIHLHHIFEGSNRKNSTKYGMIVPLCQKHHEWVHKTNYKGFKEKAQREFEKTHTREEFIKIFRRNYLWKKYGKK